MDIQKRAIKIKNIKRRDSHSFRITYDKSAVRLVESGEQRYIKAIYEKVDAVCIFFALFRCFWLSQTHTCRAGSTKRNLYIAIESETGGGGGGGMQGGTDRDRARGRDRDKKKRERERERERERGTDRQIDGQTDRQIEKDNDMYPIIVVMEIRTVRSFIILRPSVRISDTTPLTFYPTVRPKATVHLTVRPKPVRPLHWSWNHSSAFIRPTGLHQTIRLFTLCAPSVRP